MVVVVVVVVVVIAEIESGSEIEVTREAFAEWGTAWEERAHCGLQRLIQRGLFISSFMLCLLCGVELVNGESDN